MQVFKTALRIIRKKPAILLYGLIPIVMTLIFMFSTPSAVSSYDQKPVSFAIQNHDQDNPLSLALEKVLAQGNAPVDYPKSQEELRNKLFYLQINYVLEIPQGYFAQLADYAKAGSPSNTTAPQLIRTKTGSEGAQKMDQIVERFLLLSALELKVNPTQDAQQLAAKLVDTLSTRTEVKILTVSSDWSQANDFFFRFCAYGLMASIIFLIGFIFNAFRDKRILPRQLASPKTYNDINWGLGAAELCVTLGLVCIYALVALALFGKQMLTPLGLLALANMLIFALVMLCVAVFISSIMRSANSIQMFGNVLPLALSFFGGVFIPLTFLSKPIQQIALFLPSYWYTKSIDDLAKLNSYDFKSLAPILQNFAILAAFGLTFAFAALGLGYFLNKQSSDKLGVTKRHANV